MTLIRSKRILIATAFAASLWNPLWTLGGARADGVAGFEAYEKGDYATALKEFLPLAEAGQTSAQAAVGQMYFEGKGVAADPKEAARWLAPAAAAGNARAQFLLGKLYLSGEGVAPDPAKAAALSKAAADQGLVDAQVDVCALYYQGVGFPKDWVQAYVYASLAAEQGSEDGKSILELLRQDMKPEDVAKGEAAAKAWKPVLPDIKDPDLSNPIVPGAETGQTTP